MREPEPKREVAADLASTYLQYRGLLLSIVARLAREGYTCPTDEALDLVHDFFVDEAPKLLQRYDQRRAALTTYLYVAFRRFARRRLARRVRQAQVWEDARSCRVPDHLPGAVEAVEAREVRDALEAIPESDKQLLLEYFDAERPSERLMAARRDWSRYQLRIQLIEALGRLATKLARPDGIAPADWEIAKLAWKYGYTVPEVAEELDRNASDIRAARDRCRRRLATLLKIDR